MCVFKILSPFKYGNFGYPCLFSGRFNDVYNWVVRNPPPKTVHPKLCPRILFAAIKCLDPMFGWQLGGHVFYPWKSRLQNQFLLAKEVEFKKTRWTICFKHPNISKLGGGFTYFLFSPLFAEDSQILTNIFQMGWNLTSKLFPVRFFVDVPVWVHGVALLHWIPL